MKKVLFAVAMTLGLASLAPHPAEADTKVRIYLGVPHYSYRVAPDYIYRPGWGYYRPANARISCSRARDLVQRRGYRNVDRIECSGATYTFRATRNGDRTRVYVNARTGAVWR